MTIKLLAPDKETVERMKNGCNHYGLIAKYTRSTDPYVHILIDRDDAELEKKIESLFWLGANLASPQIDTSLLKSSF